MTPIPWTIYRCNEAPDDRACGIQGPPDPNIAWQMREGHSDVVCDTNREECCHMMKLKDAEFIVELRNKLSDLRNAWINMPFDGVCRAGTAEWLQPLINAVSALVDPKRTLREDPEVKRIGMIASFKSKLAWADEQIKIAIRLRDSNETPVQLLAQWATKRADIIEQCKVELGVDLL